MSAVTAYLLLATLLTGLTGRLLWRRNRPWRVASAITAWALSTLLLAGGAYSCWYHHRPLPDPVHRELFEGVTYEREVLTSPRRVVVHVVTIDLDAAGIGFLVTPGDSSAGREIRARTTSEFLNEFGVQVAVNGGFFEPWYYDGPFSYYPHSGDPVDVCGLAVSRGDRYSDAESRFTPLWISSSGRVSIGTPTEPPHNAVSGLQVLVRDGQPQPQITETKTPQEPHPRTAVALDRTGRRLMLLVVDGRQPNYSEGLTLPELAEIVVAHGGHTALNLDGGGSSTLVVQGADGTPVVLNSPVHGRVPPGRERPVANHLGIYARRR